MQTQCPNWHLRTKAIIINSLSIEKLINDGFESITLLNYLSCIGSNKNLSNEKNIIKLIDNFEISNFSSSAPKFSIDILKNLNKVIIQSYDYEDIIKKYKISNLENFSEDFWHFIKNNISFFNECYEWLNVINSKNIYIEKNDDYLKICAELLPEEPFDINSWDKWTNLIKEKTNKSGKDLFLPIRLALTGKNKGPEIKYLIPLLKGENILKKLGYKLWYFKVIIYYLDIKRFLI